MQSTPFNPERDIAPVPFEAEVLERAATLKERGLAFRPHAGCFVWDPDEHIPVASPFPRRVYFILNLGHFVRLLGSVDAVSRDLVWVPTETQAREMIGQLGGRSDVTAAGILELYEVLAGMLSNDESGPSL
jgi:hypothetical protein